MAALGGVVSSRVGERERSVTWPGGRAGRPEGPSGSFKDARIEAGEVRMPEGESGSRQCHSLRASAGVGSLAEAHLDQRIVDVMRQVLMPRRNAVEQAVDYLGIVQPIVAGLGPPESRETGDDLVKHQGLPSPSFFPHGDERMQGVLAGSPAPLRCPLRRSLRRRGGERAWRRPPGPPSAAHRSGSSAHRRPGSRGARVVKSSVDRSGPDSAEPGREEPGIEVARVLHV